MSTVRLCGLKPLLHRRKAYASEWMKNSSTTKKPPKGQNEGKGESMEWSFVSGDQLILMMEVHKKILVFRDILDLAPLNSSASLREMVITTLNDLQRIYPGIIPRNKVSKIKDKSTDQGLAYFCEALKSIGESWMMNNDCMHKKYYEFPSCKDNNNMRQIGETMLATLDCLIKIASDKLDIMEEDEQKKGFSPKSVLPEPMKYNARTGDSPRSSCSSPLWSLRIQAVGKLNPIDLKRLSFHMSPRHKEAKKKRVEKEPTGDVEIDHNHNHKDTDHGKDASEGLVFNLDTAEKSDITNADNIEKDEPQAMKEEEEEEEELSVSPTPPIQQQSSLKPLEEPTSLQKEPRPISSSSPSAPPTLTLPTPPPPPPPLPPIPTKKVSNMAMPPSPPPPPGSTSAAAAAISAPPPPLPLKNGSSAPAPTPPMLRGSGALGPKSTTRLKRSTQLGKLYQILQGKVEGSSLKGKSSGGRRVAIGAASTGGKQGLADALAEMTKRSTYFQQIEEDVQKYTKQIMELKPAISNFKTNDMKALVKFHKDVESVLENLTDESQVLSRFEGFPSKKLEAIRMAAALYNKLNSILTELQNWKMVIPVGQVLDKAELYFNKIKPELDALERTKDEESKKFKGHNIEFDFHILVKIKEAMVDVSSNCMELALKERRNDAANKRDSGSSSNTTIGGQRKECGKLLWRAFQFAFKVYKFTGGIDDRADKLTKELAEEIESSDPNNNP